MTTKRKKKSQILREALHRLVDELPDSELPSAKRFLEYLRNLGDPLMRKLMEAPYDDEPVTPEEETLVQKARDQLAHGEMIPDAEVWRRLGHEPRS